MLTALRISLLTALATLFAGWLSFGSTALADDASTFDTAAGGSGTGTLIVLAKDNAGKSVSGARVIVFPSGSSTVVATGFTGATGKVNFTGLAAGDYGIFASKVTVVFGFPIAIFGSGTATVTSGGYTGVIITLSNFAP